jgi:hypothetical protein
MAQWLLPIIPSYTEKHKWEDCDPGQHSMKKDPILKTTNEKRAGDMGQVVEHLLSKLKALSSNLPPWLKQ